MSQLLAVEDEEGFGSSKKKNKTSRLVFVAECIESVPNGVVLLSSNDGYSWHEKQLQEQL